MCSITYDNIKKTQSHRVLHYHYDVADLFLTIYRFVIYSA